MLNLATIRSHLGDGIAALGVATVYRRAIDGAASFPAVVVGQASLEEYDAQPCSIHRWELPVHVVEARPGVNEEATQQALEDLWLVLLPVVDDLVQTMPGVVEAHLTRSDFGSLMVQGMAYPAYEIVIEIYG